MGCTVCNSKGFSLNTTNPGNSKTRQWDGNADSSDRDRFRTPAWEGANWRITLQERGVAGTTETKVPFQTLATVTGAGCDSGHTCPGEHFSNRRENLGLPTHLGTQFTLDRWG